MAESTSSSPRPGPRHRPRSRKAKTTTKRHQRTEMAMREWRAPAVMPMNMVATILADGRKERKYLLIQRSRGNRKEKRAAAGRGCRSGAEYCSTGAERPREDGEDMWVIKERKGQVETWQRQTEDEAVHQYTALSGSSSGYPSIGSPSSPRMARGTCVGQVVSMRPHEKKQAIARFVNSIG